METPVCPVHGVAMRAGNKGGFYCAKKNPDGSWCNQRQSGSKPAAAAAPVASPQAQSTALAVAALNFAGALCHGQGADGLSDALAVAAKAYELGIHLGKEG